MGNSTMDKFENTINQIRDILRKEGITGMESIKHCLAFIICRTLNKDKCVKLGIDKKFVFENIIKQDEQKLCEMFHNTNDDNDSLIGQIYEKMHFSTGYKMKSYTNLKHILNKLETIDIEKLSSHFDIVGVIYELHLKSGTSQAMRDLGQYFTSRLVIDYMIKLCKPTLKKNGDIESILDPSMGTGGFLTMSIKYLNDNNKKIDWNKNKNNIYGFDIDDNVRNMALLNTFLETDYVFDRTMVKHDSLRQDYCLEDNTFIDKVDIILANEPFGLKNIVHAECCNRIKNLKIRGTKAEPLFLQLMMLSLNENGRCAVIVPDGVLFNDSNLHTDTRKYLVDNLNLKKVVSLNGDFFLNTGVKSSILFFVNKDKTKEVEFCNIQLVDNILKENIIVKVGVKDIIKNQYSLFVNKYNIKEETKIGGVEYKKLIDLLDLLPTTKHTSSIGNTTGKYRFYNSSQDNKLYLDNYEITEESIIIGNGGNLCIHYDKLFTASKHVTIAQLKLKNNLKFIYYYLFCNSNLLSDKAAGSTIMWLNKTNIGQIEIPIPSLELQQQIVDALDVIYDQIERNNKSIKAYDDMKKTIVWANTIGCKEVKKLGELCEFEPKIKKLKASDGQQYGKYNFYTSSIKILSRDDYEYTDYKIIIGRGGNSCIFYDKNFGISHDDIFVLKSNNYNLKYVYYYIKSNFHMLINILLGSTIKHINKENLSSLKIPIPPKEIQEMIIKDCEYYDEQINKLQKENDMLKSNKIIEQVLNSISENKIKPTENLENDLEDESEEDNDPQSDEEEIPINYDHKKLKRYFKACTGNLNTNCYKQYFGSKSKEEFDRNDFTVLINDVTKELESTSSHDTNAVIKLINYLLEIIDEDTLIKMLNKTKKVYIKLNKEIEL